MSYKDYVLVLFDDGPKLQTTNFTNFKLKNSFLPMSVYYTKNFTWHLNRDGCVYVNWFWF